ncbi:AAA family ATPase [Lentzea sp. NPDC051208]|uniref:AAA family ATPase n=1 Tax=Lentzea sp. NPDC051208 TaxID=3154642 RepID=UPI00342D5CB7
MLRKHRMLTLVGSAGIGKTRLAVELARRAGRAEVRTVELGRLSRPEQVVEAFAEAVGVYQRAGVALRTTLLQELGNRRILLLVDNCEHLVEECCAVVDALLSRCPNVQVSRDQQGGVAVDRRGRLPDSASSRSPPTNASS